MFVLVMTILFILVKFLMRKSSKILTDVIMLSKKSNDFPNFAGKLPLNMINEQFSRIKKRLYLIQRGFNSIVNFPKTVQAKDCGFFHGTSKMTISKLIRNTKIGRSPILLNFLFVCVKAVMVLKTPSMKNEKNN